MFIFLTVFSIILRLQKASASTCGSVILEDRDVYNCLEANKVQLLGKFVKKPFKTSLSIMNSLEKIDSQHVSAPGSNFVSLWLEDNTELIYDEKNFLPKLTSIIPNPNTKSSVIIIRGNTKFCLPKAVKDKLSNMAQNKVTIQGCNCFTKNSMKNGVCETISVEGGEKCEFLNGDLCFNSNNTIINSTVLTRLSKVEHLRGRLLINGTQFTNLSFLSSIKTVRSNSPEWTIQIQNNHKLHNLNLSLEYIENKHTDGGLLNIENNEELKFSLMEKEYYRLFLIQEAEHKDKEPLFVKTAPCKIVHPILKNIEAISECLELKGNILIDQDYDQMEPFQLEAIFGHVQYLEGCLSIIGTKIVDITFLHSLRKVNCNEKRPSVRIENNLMLETIDLAITEIVQNNRTTAAYSIKNNERLWLGEAFYLKNLLDANNLNFTKGLKKEKASRRYKIREEYHDFGMLFVVLGLFIISVGEAIFRLIQIQKRNRKALQEALEEI